MDVVSNRDPRERAERQWRITSAFFESAIGTSAALESLLGRLYRRDPDSLAHLHRVASLAIRIGEELGLAERALDDLERAALMHDIGRLVLPDPSKVTSGSLDMIAMQRRTEQVRVAHEVMKDHPFLRPAAAIVGASLECFDGSGSPDGLRGHQIPLASRVLQVADTLDALTSVCLTLSCSAEVANAELVRMAGGRFDPDVVAAWLRCSEEVPSSLMPWWSAVDRMN
jgi:response regulator RpfG family c-di-GMP phosphodiesterase